MEHPGIVRKKRNSNKKRTTHTLKDHFLGWEDDPFPFLGLTFLFKYQQGVSMDEKHPCNAFMVQRIDVTKVLAFLTLAWNLQDGPRHRSLNLVITTINDLIFMTKWWWLSHPFEKKVLVTLDYLHIFFKPPPSWAEINNIVVSNMCMTVV